MPISATIQSSPSGTLPIVQIGDPVLRQYAMPLSKEEILGPEIQLLIERMKKTMRAATGVGLAAPQIGRSIRLAVIEDTSYSHLTEEQCRERGRYPVPFHVIINPKLELVDENKTAEFFEGCLSVSGLVGVVPRAEKVRVECLNEKAEPVTIEVEGWYARILQHEIGHLNGELCIDHMLLRTATTMDNAKRFWAGKSISDVKFLNNVE